MEEIGNLINKRRLELGLTLEEVGNIVGVGKSTVRKWETGMIKNMGRDKIALLAKALSLSPTDLVPWPDSGFSSDEIHLIDNYRHLLPRGKKLLQERSEELLLLYGEKSETDSADRAL